MGLFDWLFKKKGKGVKEWAVGDRVLARWYDAFFYPGRIRQVSGKGCEVAFDDGDVAWVNPSNIVAPDISVGSRVFGRIQGGPQYLPGIVNERRGEKIQIRYDHGAEEWTTISLVRVQRGSGDGGPEESPPAPPAKQALDLGGPVEGGDWRAGDRVLARWLDFFWYPGTILAVGQKGIHVLYDDGDQRVVQEAAIAPLVIEEGEQIFIRPKSEPQRIYAPATVTRVQEETLDVEFEDGRHETNTRVSRARFWRCPVGFGSFPHEEGDRVLAYDSDDCIYPAEIVSIQDDKVIVQYLDGPERMLTPELIKKFDLRAGARVECRWKGSAHYFPGVIAKMEGERLFIKYDDGDEEWTSVRLVRIPRG